MKTVAARQTLVLIGALAFAPAAFAQYPGRSTNSNSVGVSVWKDANYRGENATFRTDVPDLSRYRFQNSISSVRIQPGEAWEVCDQPNYRGRCQVLSGSDTNLDNNNWNDRIESIRRVNQGEGRGEVGGRNDRDNRGNDRGNDRGVRSRREAGLDDAARVCTNEVQRRGYTVASSSTPARNGTTVVMDMQVRRNSRGREASARCTYDVRNGTAQMKF